MYDYVRRQQELQPSMFTTKTFQWMDQSVREPSWARRHSKTGPMDPLAYSSSSLFAAQRPTSRLAGTLGVFHRSAASLTPHRALLAFRRYRQNSDAAVRPPSGVPSSFRSRRRGFTAPPGAQPPPASPLFAAASSSVAVNASAAATAAAPMSPFPRKTVCASANPSLADAPIIKHALPQTNSAAIQQMIPGMIIGSRYECDDRQFSAGHTEKAGDVALGEMAFPFAQPTSTTSQPQLFSSFSPPNSPRPQRTICHRARLLMNRVRSARPPPGAAAQAHPAPAHQRHRHTGGGLRRRKQQQFPEIRAPRTDPANPYRISSALCVPTKDVLVSSSSSDTEDSSTKLLGPDAVMAGYPQPQGSPPHALLPGSRQARVLPRSPLANPAVIPNTDEVEDLSSSSGSGPEPSGSTGAPPNGTPVAAELASSSDDDGLTCRMCNRYRGLEWIVGCNNDHHLCFGCVQAHVKQLLASIDAFRVPCPLSRCDAHIPGRYLRDCLPPQRMQQLEANRRRSDRPARAITRYFSLGGRKIAENSGSVGPANDSDEGFDAPVVVVDNSSIAELKPRALTDHLRIHNGVPPSDQALDREMARVLIADPQRHSASMPLLPQACASPASSGTADSPTPLFMSQLTKVSTEKGSVNSVVLAASVAADSGLSLSPQSVGSRLRRVPKIPGNLNADVVSIGSPEAVASDCLGLSSPSLGQSVFLHHASTAQGDIDPLPQPYAGHVYDYSSIDYDMCMQTPPLRPPHAMSFASSSSPISWQSPARPAGQRRHRNVHSIISPKQQPEAPPPLPLPFRATATWITPEQRHSGYAENILLSATLFETIRRRSTPSDGDDSDDDESHHHHHHNASQIPRVYTSHRYPMPEIPKTSPAAEDDDNVGVYIPTWRRPETAIRKYAASPWDDIAHYGSQSGILCEAAELNFDLYETLHKRR